ncbi:nucleotide exchange factor GrpE [Methylocucumis oryzae]|uniref:Protein GrpE n=1 Tax=Methylocucumis oryzae TaxID=1632867 RepID=A0A0F3IFC8_9GAMM|nr:nucleotide exchange factor GrpE [Methylocucumis oryzae]KJV05466.1 molecular chaperone GrpE [Methylocucumis oryzae]
MSTEQETVEAQIEPEAVQSDATVSNEEQPHTEVAEHEYTIDELKQELAETKHKAQENWDKALRVHAEMENLKKRMQKDLEDTHKFAITNFAKELLTVMDSLVLGLQAATGDSEDVKKFREGSELTIKQFEAVFNKFNIVTLDPLGSPFNAEQHQAVMMQAVQGVEANTVVNVLQKGYMLNGRLLRPAMVIVAKAAD